MGSPGVSHRPSRSSWLTRFAAATLLLLVALGITHIPTGTSAQSSILVTATDGDLGPIVVPVGDTVPFMVSGLVPSADFYLTIYYGGECGIGTSWGAETFRADANGNWSVGSVSYNFPEIMGISVTQGANVSNCFVVTWADPTPTPTPSPAPDPLVLTINGGPGPVTGTAGGTASLGISGLTPFEGFEIRLTNGPTCTSAYSASSATGASTSSLNLTVGGFASNQSYSYIAVQGGRTSNCVTISIPPDPTATNTPAPTATSTPEPTATPIPLVMTINGGPGPVTGTSGETATLGISGLTPLEGFELRATIGPTCTPSYSLLQVAGIPTSSTTVNVSPIAPNQSYSYLAVQGGQSSNCVTLTIPPDPTPTNTTEPTATNTPEPTLTSTPEPKATNTPEPTATNTPEPTPTNTLEPTATSTPESTATSTNTPVPTSTSTPVATATSSPQPSATPTPSPTSTATGGQGTISTPSPSPSPTEPITELPNTGSGSNPAALAVGMMLAFAIAFGLFALIANGRRRRS